MPTPAVQAAHAARDATVADLVTGIVADTGELLGAHVESIRHEIAEGLADVRDRTQAIARAGAVLVATLTILSVALGLTLVRAGLPPWLSFWLVGAVLLAASLVMLGRVRGPSRDADPVRALSRARDDAAWLADRAVETVT